MPCTTQFVLCFRSDSWLSQSPINHRLRRLQLVQSNCTCHGFSVHYIALYCIMRHYYITSMLYHCTALYINIVSLQCCTIVLKGWEPQGFYAVMGLLEKLVIYLSIGFFKICLKGLNLRLGTKKNPFFYLFYKKCLMYHFVMEFFQQMWQCQLNLWDSPCGKDI